MNLSTMLSLALDDIETLEPSLEQDDCTVDDLLVYLKRCTFPRNSIGFHLKNRLEESIKRKLKDPAEYEVFIKSSAFYCLKMLLKHPQDRANGMLLFKTHFEQSLTSYIDFTLHESQKSLQDYESAYLALCKEREEDPLGYGSSNHELHKLCLVLTAETDFSFVMNASKDQLLEKSWDNTPLLLACKTGYHEYASHLIEQYQIQHAHVNDVDSHGMSALHWACFFRNDALIKQLIHAGANVNIKNRQGQLPIDLYQKNAPLNISIVGGSSGVFHLAHTSMIAGNLNRIISVPTHETLVLDDLVDIIFHMDKIATHQLDVSKADLGRELDMMQYEKRHVNGYFEIFVYFHLKELMSHRNAKPVSQAVTASLSNIPDDTLEHSFVLHEKPVSQTVMASLSNIPDDSPERSLVPQSDYLMQMDEFSLYALWHWYDYIDYIFLFIITLGMYRYAPMSSPEDMTQVQLNVPHEKSNVNESDESNLQMSNASLKFFDTVSSLDEKNHDLQNLDHKNVKT